MSWALAAVEKEAAKRAKDDLIKGIASGRETFLICGLNFREIAALMSFYENHTGREARNILVDQSS